jgi:hypothetical protein
VAIVGQQTEYLTPRRRHDAADSYGVAPVMIWMADPDRAQITVAYPTSRVSWFESI